jgi:hypothetical protein
MAFRIEITSFNLPSRRGFGNGIELIFSRLVMTESDSESDYGYPNFGYNPFELEYNGSSDEECVEEDSHEMNCQKYATIFANCSEMEDIKTNPADYLNEYFNKLKAKLEADTKSHVSYLRKLKNSSKKVRKAKASLASRLSELDRVKEVCVNNLKQNRSSIKSEANKLYRLLENPNFKVERDEKTLDEMFNLNKNVYALKCKLLSGYSILYRDGIQNGKDRSLCQLAIGNCYDYKKANADGQLVAVDKNEAESIFYYEVCLNFEFLSDLFIKR